MRKRLVAALTFIVSTFSASSTRAGTLELSLEDALSRVEQRSFSVRDARNQVQQIEARRYGLGMLIRSNPQIRGEARPPITGGTMHDLGYAGTIELLFDFGGAPSARVSEVTAEAQVAQRQVNVSFLDARAEIQRSYLRARIADARIEEAQILRQIADRVLDAARQRESAGSAGEIDVALARTGVAEASVRLEAVKRERETALMELRGALDLTGSTELRLTSPLEDPKPLAERDRLIQRALERRPEIQSARDRLTLLDRTETRLKRENFPLIGFYAGVDAAPVSPIFGYIGMSMELPVFLRNQGPRAVVEKAREGELRRLDFEKRRVERDVIVALESFNARLAELKILTGEGLPAARRSLELVDQGWRAGRFDIFRVTSAARDVARLADDRLNALEAAWTEQIAIVRATGGDAQ